MSVYASWCGLGDYQKDSFYDSLVSTAANFGEEVVVIGGNVNGHVFWCLLNQITWQKENN